MDIIKILSYGITGLGFLLALLSYRLLLKEQAKEVPRKSILNSIYIFMLFSVILSILGLTSELSKTLTKNSKEANVVHQMEPDYFLGDWHGKAEDIVNNNKKNGNTVSQKYSYELTFEFKRQNDSILMTGGYTAKPMNLSTKYIPQRFMSGYAIQDGDYLRVIYQTKANPQPTGKGIGVFNFRFLPTGNHADGYYVSRSLSDGEFIVGWMTLDRE